MSVVTRKNRHKSAFNCTSNGNKIGS